VDAFESLVASIFRDKGYWVEESFKVALTKAEKVEIGRPSCPRWELDVVAYKARDNEVLAIECKSYLDSRGVSASAVMGESDASTYKLFREETLRNVVFRRLAAQLAEAGTTLPNPKVTLCLATGLVKSGKDRDALKAHFSSKEWKLFDEPWLRQSLKDLSDRSYQNSVASIVAKILCRAEA